MSGVEWIRKHSNGQAEVRVSFCTPLWHFESYMDGWVDTPHGFYGPFSSVSVISSRRKDDERLCAMELLTIG